MRDGTSLPDQSDATARARGASMGRRQTVDWRISGVRITPMSLVEVIRLVGERIDADAPCVIANINMHALYLCRTDPRFRRLTEGAFVIIDGMPVVWFARLLGYPLTRRHRVTWVDLIWPL